MKGELINTLDTSNSLSHPLSPCLWNKIHSSLIIPNNPSAGLPKNLSCWVHITPDVSVLGAEHRGQHWRHNQRPGTRYMVMSAPASPRALASCHTEGCRYSLSRYLDIFIDIYYLDIYHGCVLCDTVSSDIQISNFFSKSLSTISNDVV